MGNLIKSQRQNIKTLDGNGLSVFIDGTSDVLSLKDIRGNVKPFSDVFTPSNASSPFEYGSGCLTIKPVSGNNQVCGSYSTIAGGKNNLLLGSCSIIGGGNYNFINCGTSSSIVAGVNNYVCGGCFTIITGSCNKTCGASNIFSGIINGSCNIVCNSQRVFTGNGQSNLIVGSQRVSVFTGINIQQLTSCTSFSGTGKNNRVSMNTAGLITGCCNVVARLVGQTASIVGTGRCHENFASSSFFVTGYSNRSVQSNNFIGTGSNHYSNCSNNTLLTGNGNIACSSCSIVFSGTNNVVRGNCDLAVIGGQNNTILGFRNSIVVAKDSCINCCNSFIGTSNSSRVFSINSAIISGYCNLLCGGSCCAFIGNGCFNTICGSCSFVGNGTNNFICGTNSSVVAGCFNFVCGSNASIVSGKYNTLRSNASVILGSSNNYICNTLCNTVIAGCGICADRSQTLFANNLSLKNIPTSSAGLPAGAVWSDGGTLKIV